MANPVTIYIHHQSYRFLAEEEETYLQQCADIVNKEMDQAMDNLRAQLKQALDENARLARELAEAKREARKAARGEKGTKAPKQGPRQEET